eukprot:COSAG04_NODE_31437_length_256_cov_41271.808917_1_plen_59_part_10
MASYSQALDILEPLSEAMDPDEAARVVELSVYCMVESARCYHNLSQVILYLESFCVILM